MPTIIAYYSCPISFYPTFCILLVYGPLLQLQRHYKATMSLQHLAPITISTWAGRKSSGEWLMDFGTLFTPIRSTGDLKRWYVKYVLKTMVENSVANAKLTKSDGQNINTKYQDFNKDIRLTRCTVINRCSPRSDP